MKTLIFIVTSVMIDLLKVSYFEGKVEAPAGQRASFVPTPSTTTPQSLRVLLQVLSPPYSLASVDLFQALCLYVMCDAWLILH